jgi:RNA polymerase sigma-70 factor, ECF subfamily
MMTQRPPERASQIECLYTERYRSFYRLALSVTGDSEAARDAVQEGFARALGRRGEFRADGSLEGWVYRIVLRCALDSRRGVSRSENGLPEQIDVAWMPEFPYPDRDPELTDAMRALPRRQRTMVFMRYFADLPLATIAELCGTRLGTVSATLAQAKATLAARLAPTIERTERETHR